jgi:hypothetical protein
MVLFDRLNLDLLGRQLEMPVRIASRANGSASLEWPGLDAKSAEGEARVQFTPTRQQPSPDVIPLAGSLSATRRNKTLHLSTNGLTALGANLRAEVSIGAADQLQGDVQAEIGDLNQVVSSLDQFRGSPDGESVLPLAVAGPAALTASTACRSRPSIGRRRRGSSSRSSAACCR